MRKKGTSLKKFVDYHTISLNAPSQFVEMSSRIADMCASKMIILNVRMCDNKYAEISDYVRCYVDSL